MTEKDLCVGDLFKVNGYVTRVKDIVHLDKEDYYVVGCTTLENRYIPVCYEPIPLTGDILKANGFNREGGASYWHEGDRDACILHWSKDKDQLVIGSPCDECMVKMNVRYVHELQHAFRLAGIDYEIKLEC